MPYVFFRKLQLVTVLLFFGDSYTSWSARFVTLKKCVVFSIFVFFMFSLNFIFFFNKKHGIFDFKTS